MFAPKFTETLAHDEKIRPDRLNRTRASSICSCNPGGSLTCLRVVEEYVPESMPSTSYWITLYPDIHSLSSPCKHVSSSAYKLDLSNISPNLPLSDNTSSFLTCDSILHNQPAHEIIKIFSCLMSMNNLGESLTSFTDMACSSCCCPQCCGQCSSCMGQFCGQCPCGPCEFPFGPGVCPWRCRPSSCFGNCGPCGPCGPCGRCGCFQGPLQNINFAPVPVSGLPFPNLSKR